MADHTETKTYQKRWYEKNRTHLLSKWKERYASDPEFRHIQSERGKAWRYANLDRLRQKEKARYQSNKEALAAASKKRYLSKKTDPEFMRQRREKHLRQKHGLSFEDVSLLLANQNGLCALCGQPLSRNGAVVDHDHQTGCVRGILHNLCNVRLYVIENPIFVRQAQSYLAKTRL